MTFNGWLKKINDTVASFVHSIDEEYECRMGQTFCAFIDEDVVEWSLVYKEEGGKAFYENFVERYPKAKGFSLFTLCILHEVGHLETQDEMRDDTKARNRIKSHKAYFNLFNERIATDWAGMWIDENYKAAVKLDDSFRSIISNFYKNTLTF